MFKEIWAKSVRKALNGHIQYGNPVLNKETLEMSFTNSPIKIQFTGNEKPEDMVTIIKDALNGN